MGEKSLDDYKSRLKGLNKWLKKNHKTVVYINELNKKLVLDYLNQVQLNSSARNRNNYRTVFSTIFQVLEDNELIDKNFITQISILKTTPKRHKTYTIKEQNEIFEYLEVNDNNENLIEVVPVKASAGYLAGYDDPEYIEQLQKIKLPFLPTGKHRAFPIKGDSMLPMKDGAFVIGRFVEDRSEIKTGKTYVLVTLNDGMVYKRVYNNIDLNNSLLLMSDNKTYNDYSVPIDEILEIWEFTCSINTQEYSEEELKISSILGMFNELGVELKALNKIN
ncbi:S24 family peptidase [Postechiella marina]|uniref:S24 family peptidase n=1 Tax=Postechiella marina TaxID=943941 RepID=UPI003CD09B1D